MAGVLSNQTKFYYSTTSGETTTWTPVNNLMEVPSLGGTPDKIEITCLDDIEHKYMNGIKSYGDSLAFKFLYDGTATTGNYALLSALTGTQQFKVEFNIPSGQGTTGHTFTFSGEPSVVMDAITNNSALTFTLNIAPQSAIVYA